MLLILRIGLPVISLISLGFAALCFRKEKNLMGVVTLAMSGLQGWMTYGMWTLYP